MSKTRAIRLSDAEDKLIEEFLSKNKVFDFSSLARTAIIGFIHAPKLSLQPVKEAISQKRKGERNVHPN